MDYTTPGVHIEEQAATGPIAAVGTSTAAFLGVAGAGPVGEPVAVTNLAQFNSTFVPGGTPAAPDANLVRGVSGFFQNGGTLAYVARIGLTAKRAGLELKSAGPAGTVLTVTARRPGTAGNNIKVEVQRPDEPADDAHFTLVVTGPNDGQSETFADLSMDPADAGFVGNAFADTPVEVLLASPDERTPPAKASATALKDGADADPGTDGTAWNDALTALAKIDEVNIVCAPGVTATDVQKKLVDHCEVATRDRFAVLDAAPGSPVDAVLAQRGALESAGGYAALYHPWLLVPDPDKRGATIAVPPSGHVAGVYARVDAQRGVHKAPANELIAGVVGVDQVVDDTDHGRLNEQGVNVVRVFAGRSTPTVWGARTTSRNTAWQYVNVRRLFLFLEESVQEGVRWAVFEPNDLGLWKRLDRTITEFLMRVWSSGALFGANAAEAFYVTIDRSNNPVDEQELGRVVVEIGVAPVRPAEFIVVRIGMWAGGAQVQEG